MNRSATYYRFETVLAIAITDFGLAYVLKYK